VTTAGIGRKQSGKLLGAPFRRLECQVVHLRAALGAAPSTIRIRVAVDEDAFELADVIAGFRIPGRDRALPRGRGSVPHRLPSTRGQARPGLLGGFLAKTGLDLTPFCNRTINDLRSELYGKCTDPPNGRLGSPQTEGAAAPSSGGLMSTVCTGP
jgi:hypothetical protein